MTPGLRRCWPLVYHVEVCRLLVYHAADRWFTMLPCCVKASIGSSVGRTDWSFQRSRSYGSTSRSTTPMTGLSAAQSAVRSGTGRVSWSYIWRNTRASDRISARSAGKPSRIALSWGPTCACTSTTDRTSVSSVRNDSCTVATCTITSDVSTATSSRTAGSPQPRPIGLLGVIVRENMWSKAEKRKSHVFGFSKKCETRKTITWAYRPKVLGLKTTINHFCCPFAITNAMLPVYFNQQL